MSTPEETKKMEQQLNELKKEDQRIENIVNTLKSRVDKLETKMPKNKMEKSLKNLRWKRFGIICIGIVFFSVLGVLQYELLIHLESLGENGNHDKSLNMSLKIWMWAMVAFVFVVQIVIAYIQVLSVWKYNQVIKKLDLLKLKNELNTNYSSVEIEREIQLLMRILDKKII